MNTESCYKCGRTSVKSQEATKIRIRDDQAGVTKKRLVCEYCNALSVSEDIEIISRSQT